MLKSSKWSPWQPPQDCMDSLEQRAASSQVAGALLFAPTLANYSHLIHVLPKPSAS